jgi:mono/diheme cytochrome c family protein
MNRFTASVLVTAGGVALVFWFLTQPASLDPGDLPDHVADSQNGALLFHAGGCASCHTQPESGEEEQFLLGGGLELVTDFGIFRVPNISPDPDTGIGQWSPAQFVNAMLNGVSPQGRHYYPAFPYTSYTRMKTEDVLDLKAFLDTLPAVDNPVGGHDLAFPWNLRRGIGLWKRRYMDSAPVIAIDETDAVLVRGRYLAEGPAHCGECHTPRDRAGGLEPARWLSGAPNPDGEGRVPNITPHADGLGEWSLADIAYYFKSGLTPDYDTSGGSMVQVQENISQLPDSDRKAIAAYLKAVPALADSRAGRD